MKKENGLFEFIQKSPTAYHAVAEIKRRLLQCGFSEISERDSSSFAGECCFVIRESSIIAFKKKSLDSGFMICASHSDSPAFKIKGIKDAAGAYSELSTEPYGGLIYYSWLDRPLSLAGRVAVETKNGIEMRLVNFERDVAVIPSLAIHMNRTVNDGVKLNPAKDLLPLLSLDRDTDIKSLLANELSVKKEEIVAHDLFLYSREEPRTVGKGGEFMLSPRIDDLACVYTSLEAFVEAEPRGVSVLCVFDNEEVGSATKQGAGSTFLHDTLLRIAGSREKYLEMLSNSFMVSADNAHAKHPNYPECSDPDNAPVLGGGVVVKYNANQRYTTDARSDAIFRTICKKADLPLQSYLNRADMPGGSTLGSIADTKVGISTIDIGVAQLAMHSASELAALSDISDMKKAIAAVYSSSILTDKDVTKIL